MMSRKLLKKKKFIRLLKRIMPKKLFNKKKSKQQMVIKISLR
jgi:hypothetical protein